MKRPSAVDTWFAIMVIVAACYGALYALLALLYVWADMP